jgi:hypothetical protein
MADPDTAHLLELAAGLRFWPALTDPEHIARLREQTPPAIPAARKGHGQIRPSHRASRGSGGRQQRRYRGA